MDEIALGKMIKNSFHCNDHVDPHEVARMVIEVLRENHLEIIASTGETPRYEVAEQIIQVIAQEFPAALNDDDLTISTALGKHSLRGDDLHITEFDQSDAFSPAANR